MAFHYEIVEDKVIFSFDRYTTQAFAELLKRNEGKACKIEDPLFGKTELVGYIDEVSFVQLKGDGGNSKYADTSWVVEVELDDILALRIPFDAASNDLKLPQNINYFCGNMVMGVPTFHRVYSISLTKSTSYEVFTDLIAPDTTKSSESWDHRESIEEVLFGRKRVFVKKGFTELPWAEVSLDGASILVPTSKRSKGGSRSYTELGLAIDGWTYSSDLLCSNDYEEMPVEDAIRFVKNATIQANHNP